MLTFFERSPLDQVLRNDKVHRIQPCFQSPIKISGTRLVSESRETLGIITTWCRLNDLTGDVMLLFQKSCGPMDSVWPTQKPSYLITVSLRRRRGLRPPTLWSTRTYWDHFLTLDIHKKTNHDISYTPGGLNYLQHSINSLLVFRMCKDFLVCSWVYSKCFVQWRSPWMWNNPRTIHPLPLMQHRKCVCAPFPSLGVCRK